MRDNPLTTVLLTWQKCLDKDTRSPVDANGIPLQKCPTLMASSNSHSDRSGSTHVFGHDNKPRESNIHERERLVGMCRGDTAAQNVSHASRRRMCGNAFPVGWIGASITC